MKKTISIAICVAALCACSSQSQESGPTATDYLLVKLTETGSPESCRIEQLSTITDDLELYMVEFDRYINGQKQMFSQMQFTGHDGIDFVRDRSTLLTFEGAPCNTYAVEWRNLECINQNRDKIECPEVRFEGAEIFKSISIAE